MTFCGPACDTLLSNQDTEELNFDSNYITKNVKQYIQCGMKLKRPIPKKGSNNDMRHISKDTITMYLEDNQEFNVLRNVS